MSGEATYAVTMRPIAKNDTPTPDKGENRESPVNPVISDCGENQQLDQAPANAEGRTSQEPML